MGRKLKYRTGTVVTTVTFESEQLKRIDELAEKEGRTRSDIINNMLSTILLSEEGFARAQAKAALQDFQYWKGRLEIIQAKKLLDAPSKAQIPGVPSEGF